MLLLILELLLALNFRRADSHSLVCTEDTLRFPGVLKTGNHRFFLPGDGFTVTCHRGYHPSRPGGRVVCRNGTWAGHLPPCVADDCPLPPPPVANGRIKSSTRWHHFSTATYECDAPFFLSGQPSVRCLFGEWTGQLPVCRDSRCYPQDLKNSNWIVSISKNVTSSGDHLNFVCAEGFVPVDPRPLCTNGVWLEQERSPCKEAGCNVKEISNGALMDVQTKKTWRWSKMRRQEKEVFIKVMGRTKAAGSSLHVQCDEHFSFQSTGNNTVKCVKGSWHPDPVCSPLD